MIFKLKYLLVGLIFLITVSTSGYDKIQLFKISHKAKKIPQIDTTTFFDANNIKMGMRNTGHLIDPFTQFEWPINSGLYSIFTGGLWVSGKINNELRIAAVLYDTSAYLPGTIINGVPQPPSNPNFRFYKIFDYDTIGSNPDYDNWPVLDGAPVSPFNSPLKKSEQNIWCVYNDSQNPSREFSTQPLSVEIQQFVYGGNIPDEIQNTVFVEFKIINKGNTIINDAYIGLWLDFDIGFFADDLVGIDTTLNLVYAYNYNEEDLYYGEAPPAVGVVLLKPPTSEMQNYSFIGFVHQDPIWGDPDNVQQAYNFMKGLKRDGTNIINPATNNITRIMFSGDPILQTGWIDTSSNDKKILLSFGPTNLQPNEVRAFHFAIAVGSGNNRLISILNLKESIPHLTNFYENNLIRILNFSQYNIYFDTLMVGSEKTTPVVIKNNGEGTVNIDSIISDNYNFTVNQNNINILPGDSSIIEIKFSPQSTGIQSGKIIFYHNAFKNIDTIFVQGEGVIYTPTFFLPATIIDFDSVFVDSIKTKLLKIYNTGNGTLNINSIISTNSDISVYPAYLNISPYDSSFIYITFQASLQNPEQGYIIINHNAPSTPDTIMVSGDKYIVLSRGVTHGWNLLSLPIKFSNTYIRNIFPTASSSAFVYQNGYILRDSIHNGIGFWLKFPSNETITFIGKPITAETLNVATGWNLIGSPSYIIQTDNIIQTPENNIISKFYKFEGSYIQTDKLYPGYGYWVKINSPGLLIFKP